MITAFASNRVIDYNFGSVAYSGGLPATYYVGLSTTTINFDGTGITEPSGGGYARKAFTNNKTNFGTASNGILSNLVAVTFDESWATWGVVTYVGMWDALSGGNLWWYDVLTPSREILELTTFTLPIGAITVTFNNT